MKTLHNISKNIKLTLILSVLVMLCSVSLELLACPIEFGPKDYGTLKGVVFTPYGEPAIGGTVRIMGTTKGAKIKAGGEFTVSNILPGKYEIRITYTGTKDYKDSVVIMSGVISSIGEIEMDNTGIHSTECYFREETEAKDSIVMQSPPKQKVSIEITGELLKIYPNPVVNSSIVEFVSQENMITKVLVTNLNTMISKEIYVIEPNFKESKLEKFNINSFDFSEFADGEYLISLVYQNEIESEVKSSLKFIINKNN